MLELHGTCLCIFTVSVVKISHTTVVGNVHMAVHLYQRDLRYLPQLIQVSEATFESTILGTCHHSPKKYVPDSSEFLE